MAYFKYVVSALSDGRYRTSRTVYRQPIQAFLFSLWRHSSSTLQSVKGGGRGGAAVYLYACVRRSYNVNCPSLAAARRFVTWAHVGA